MADKLFVYLSYDDAPAALRWLDAIGFSTVTQQLADGGTVVHAEVRRGSAVLMIASNDQPYMHPPLMNRSTGSGVYLLVDDVELVYQQAVEAGASPVIEPETTDWGSVRARVLDPEGYEWSFGTYEPGQ